MKYTIFNTQNNNPLQEPMFLGNPVNVARYDQQKYPVFEKLIEKQLSFFWRPEEIDISMDRKQFNDLPEHEKHIFVSNLKYQTLLDSIQGRSPNVVLLPLVSIPELETWIETWSFSECVVADTEVLTTLGWKYIQDVTTDDEILVYDLNSETSFFEKPKRTTNYQVDNRLLVEFKSKNPKQFHQIVTPNHRMPVKNRVKNGHSENKRFVEAGIYDFQSNHLAPVAGRTTNPNAKSLTYIDRLLIASQADGSWQPKRYTGKHCGTIPVWFEFSKQYKIDRLKYLCKQANIEIIELTSTVSNGNIKAKQRFKINLPIQNVPKDIKDFTSWVNLKEVDSQYAQEFLNELSYWDSHKTTYAFTYSTTIKANIDIVQALSLMAGKQARLSIRKDNRKQNYKDIYSLNIVDRTFKDGQSIKKNLVPYTGKVYCIETTTGAFPIRYKGVVSITGNTIHSRSYTHIIRNIFTKPNEIFEDIILNEAIIKRAEALSQYYDDLYHYSLNYLQGKPVDKYELKKKIYLCIMAINVLEAVRFYVSFACSFAFAERKLMEGNAKIIKMIARDEQLHLNGTQAILKLLPKDDIDFKQIIHDCEQEAINIFKQASDQEKEWVKYLFKDGSMLGLNESILNQYIEYITNLRMEAIGLPSIYPKATYNPIGWINNWLTSDNVQVAPQETEITAYLVGQINNELSEINLGDFEL